jgi:hypothetical protein
MSLWRRTACIEPSTSQVDSFALENNVVIHVRVTTPHHSISIGQFPTFLSFKEKESIVYGLIRATILLPVLEVEIVHKVARFPRLHDDHVK